MLLKSGNHLRQRVQRRYQTVSSQIPSIDDFISWQIGCSASRCPARGVPDRRPRWVAVSESANVVTDCWVGVVGSTSETKPGSVSVSCFRPAPARRIPRRFRFVRGIRSTALASCRLALSAHVPNCKREFVQFVFARLLSPGNSQRTTSKAELPLPCSMMPCSFFSL